MFLVGDLYHKETHGCISPSKKAIVKMISLKMVQRILSICERWVNKLKYEVNNNDCKQACTGHWENWDFPGGPVE